MGTSFTNESTGDLIQASHITEMHAPINNLESSVAYLAVGGSGTDTYTATVTPTPASYVTGFTIHFKPDVANTGACTINLNSLGAKNIKTQAIADPVDNTLVANGIYVLVYDGTQFQIVQSYVPQNVIVYYAVGGSGNDTYTATVVPAPAAYVAGLSVNFKPDVNNVGACTINLNSLGAKNIKTKAIADPTNDTLVANGLYSLVYDGTQFQIVA